MTAGLELYWGAAKLLHYVLPWWLRLRAHKGLEDAGRLQEKMGEISHTRPDGTVIWCHAASVGECRAALPLVQKMLQLNDHVSVIITTVTRTGAEMVAQNAMPRLVHQYAPLDTPQAVARFLAHWQPAAMMVIENELWPNTLRLLAHKNIPAMLINARLSDTSLRRWRRIEKSFSQILNIFQIILPQTPALAETLRTITTTAVAYVGNIKAAGSQLRHDAQDVEKIKRSIGARPVVLLASTHEGEDDLAVEISQATKKHHPLIIIAPRHPARAGQIVQKLHHFFPTILQRSHGHTPGADTLLYLADSMGEMGRWFALADITVLGGSFVPRGGHNPLEPAWAHTAIITGPDMRNQVVFHAEMLALGAILQIERGEVAATVDRLLGNAQERETLQRNAHAYAAQQGDVLEKVFQQLRPHLERVNIRA
ncbi:MAG: hypothetical protein EBQ89_10540 [Alphaproteobacteria bacterium]|nr:hypothetical protein [Alphaproteobacteria bacterium]